MLPEKVQFVIIMVLENSECLTAPPPRKFGPSPVTMLPKKVLLVIVNVPSLLIAPPPFAAVLLLNVLSATPVVP